MINVKKVCRLLVYVLTILYVVGYAAMRFMIFTPNEVFVEYFTLVVLVFIVQEASYIEGWDKSNLKLLYPTALIFACVISANKVTMMMLTGSLICLIQSIAIIVSQNETLVYKIKTMDEIKKIRINYVVIGSIMLFNLLLVIFRIGLVIKL